MCMECVLKVLWDAGTLWLWHTQFWPFPLILSVSSFFLFLLSFPNAYFSVWVLFICLSNLLFLGLQVNGKVFALYSRGSGFDSSSHRTNT